MLVLTRKMSEKILINKGQIQIQVINLTRKRVTLGISAPKHIDVEREEIYLSKQANFKPKVKKDLA